MNRLNVIALVVVAIVFLAACPPIAMGILIILAVNGGAHRRRRRERIARARARAELQRDRELILACKALG